MFDCIRLTGTGDEAVQPISSSLITSVEAAGFEYKQEDGTRFQPVMVDMVQYDHPRTLTFTCGTVKEKRLIETGSSIQQILLPSSGKQQRKCLRYTTEISWFIKVLSGWLPNLYILMPTM